MNLRSSPGPRPQWELPGPGPGPGWAQVPVLALAAPTEAVAKRILLGTLFGIISCLSERDNVD